MFDFNKDETGNFMSNAAAAIQQPQEEPKSEEPEISGLDKLSELLYPKKEGEDDSTSTSESEPPIDPTKIFEDPEAVNKVMASMDFTKNISDDTLKMLEANDPKGLTSLVNDTSKAAFLEAIKVASHLNRQVVDDAVSRALEQSKGQITESLGDYELNQAMPEISNPVIRLGLEAVKNQLKTQNPSMSPKEMAGHLKTYLKEANETVNAQPKAPESGKADPGQESWADWLS